MIYGIVGIGLVLIGIVGYILYKIIVKHETPTEAMAEMKNEFVNEVHHIEEIVEHQIDETLTSLEEKNRKAKEEKAPSVKWPTEKK